MPFPFASAHSHNIQSAVDDALDSASKVLEQLDKMRQANMPSNDPRRGVLLKDVVRASIGKSKIVDAAKLAQDIEDAGGVPPSDAIKAAKAVAAWHALHSAGSQDRQKKKGLRWLARAINALRATEAQELGFINVESIRILTSVRTIWICSALLTLCMWAFPPWVHYGRSYQFDFLVTHPHGYYFIADTQQGESIQSLRFISLEIDYGRLIAQTVFLTSAIGLLAFYLSRKELNVTESPGFVGVDRR